MSTANDRIEQLIGRVLDGEATVAEQAEVQEFLASNPEDATLRQFSALGDHLRADIAREMEDVDLSGIWAGVSSGLDASERLQRAGGVTLGERLRTWFERLVPAPTAALGWAAAAAAIVIFAFISPRFTPSDGYAAVGDVEIEQVDSPSGSTVMIYDDPDVNVKVIWLFEEGEG